MNDLDLQKSLERVAWVAMMTIFGSTAVGFFLGWLARSVAGGGA